MTAAGLPAAVLWDMDGTLVDTEPYWMACEFELVARYGGTWTEDDATSIVGFDLIAAAERMRDRGGVPLTPGAIVDQLVAGVIDKVRQRVPWRPGARRLLADLRAEGVPCALVTMSWEPLARVIVDQLAPGTFRAVITGDMVTNGKPHPEPYLRAAQQLGVDPHDAVAIEDSPTGARSALAAGCVVLGVPNHVAIPDASTHHQVSALSGVTPAQLGRLVQAAPPPVSARSRSTPEASGPRADERTPPRGRAGPDPRRPDRRVLIAAAVVVALLAAFALSRGGGGGEEEPRVPDRLVLHTWVPYWTAQVAAETLEERADAIHELSPFWFNATGVESIERDPNASAETTDAFLSTARDQGIPLVASILDATDPGTMAGILADADQRSAHVDAIARFAADGDFAGIDIDYERFAFDDGRETWATTRPNWVAFVEELSARLHDDDRTLTVSIPPVYDAGQTADSGFWVYDYAAITPHVDHIRVMAYDYSVAASEPGPIAPLAWVDQVVAGTTAASGDPSKLILGVPLYGRNWPTAASGECPESAPGVETVTNRVVDELVARRDATPTYDPAIGEWTFSYEAEFSDGGITCTQQRTVFYVDDDGVQQRVQRALDAGLGGVSLFALGYDDQEVWNNIAAINATFSSG